MVCVGDWQIQIIPTQSNQYQASGGGNNGQSTDMTSQILPFVCPPVILFLKN